MPALALAVGAIALPDSLNPSLIVAAVYLALGPHPVRRTLGFTLAAFAVTLAGGLAVALGLGDLILSLLPKLSHTVKWDVITGVGILLMAGGVVLWWRRDALVDGDAVAGRDPPAGKDPASIGEPAGGGSAVLLGAGIAGVEFLTAFPYFAAIALVLGSSVSLPGKVFLIVLYNVVYVLPLIAIVIVAAVMGDKAGKLLSPVSAWISTHWPMVAAPFAGAVGVALTTYGIAQLS